MVLSCQQVDAYIEQRIEGALSRRDQEALERHLRACSRCCQREARERGAVAALRDLPAALSPPGLAGRVMAALPNVSPRLLGQLAQVLRRATLDAELRRRLRENPYAALLSQHIALPPGLRVEIVSEQPAPLPTTEVLYLPLPEQPLELQELEQRLAAMGLGAFFGLWW